MSEQTRDIDTIDAIQATKAKELAGRELPPLDPEHEALAEHKRFTFDIVATPTDPLR